MKIYVKGEGGLTHVIEYGDSNDVMKDKAAVSNYIPYAIPDRHRGEKK